jgi:hypothetical protein
MGDKNVEPDGTNIQGGSTFMNSEDCYQQAA